MEQYGRAVTAVMLAMNLLAVGCGSTGSTPHVDAAAGGATGGNAGTGGSAGTPGEPVPPVPPVNGRWSMFSAEDPVGIELTVTNGVVSGRGCYGGLPTTLYPDLANSCRPLAGTAEGRHLQFSFLAEPFYAADVYASSDGQRMAGDFRATGPNWYSSYTWLRIADDFPVLRPSSEPSAVGLALEARSILGDYELEGLVDHFGRPGRLSVLGFNRTVVGTLGAFWETEMTWNEAEQTLVAGPVPETAPDLATQLTMHFSPALTLVSVDAIFPSGEARTFARRYQP